MWRDGFRSWENTIFFLGKCRAIEIVRENNLRYVDENISRWYEVRGASDTIDWEVSQGILWNNSRTLESIVARESRCIL